ncbi:peptidoglycan DD-metalloendopeptidase family protein [Arsukibacterium sp.]|uniref:peptidoglycan DD-metalloendopeptidase family protein n=1 Tax=Arsukibacterium sp. TaxID=1977258 RepID=UPI001BD21C50|nr:peptidoglycan DD-metalloendopeptidase family protein [Arsukibacterium sp.]
MAQQLLISLGLCSVWAALLWWACPFLLRKIPELQQWPAFYWWLLALCFLPLLPLPQLEQQWVVPSVLLQDTFITMQTLNAQPAHPALNQPPSFFQQHWAELLLLLLAMVSFGQLVRLKVQWQKLQQLVALTEPLPLASLLSPAQRAALPANIELRQTQAAVSPFTAGWRQRVIVVPAYIWQLTEQQRQLLLTHELLHLQRRDPQQLMVLRILVAACWFIPALKHIEQAFIRSMELAVDQAVLAKQPELATLYGQTLLSCLQLSRSGQLSGLSAGFIHGNAGKGFYQQRLQQLFQRPAGLSAWQRWRLFGLFAGSAVMLQLSSAAFSYSEPPQQWLLPVEKPVISSFYAQQHPFRQNRPHQGLDFAAATGAPVSASQNGKVLIADADSLNSRYGKVVLIDHGHGYQTLYAHLDSFSVTAGQRINAGEPIGTVGSSGRVTGPHLHFEILQNGRQQDPAAYLKLP